MSLGRLWNGNGIITNCDSLVYYKVRHVLLQVATGITARSARKKNKEFSPSPPLSPSAGGQQIPRGFCFLSRALDGL